MKRLATLGCAWLSAVAHAQSVLPPSMPPLPVILPIPQAGQPDLPLAGQPDLPLAGQNVVVATDDSARMSVPVTIDGRTWQFLIDTASTRSVIASDVADRLDLAKGDNLRILTITGIDAVPSVIIPKLGFSTFTVRGIDAPSLARGNLGGDGLLGLDILRNIRLSIDFRYGTTLTISPAARRPQPNASHSDPDTIIVMARSRMGELIVTDADIDGIPVSVIIDTGSQDSIGTRPWPGCCSEALPARRWARQHWSASRAGPCPSITR